MRPLLGEHRTDAAIAIFRTAAQVRFLQAPGRCLGVQIIDIFERTGRKKSVSNKTDCSFHAAFFVPAGDRHRAWLEPIMSGQLQQRRMEADRIASPLEDCAFEVVIEHHPRHRAPSGKCLDMAAQEVVHRAVQIKSQEQVPRVRQHHHEGHQRPGRLADFDRTEVGPVALGLFAGEGAQAQICFRQPAAAASARRWRGSDPSRRDNRDRAP